MQIFFCKDNKFWRKTATQLRNFHANLSKNHPIFPFFSQYRWVTGVTDPSTKKLKTRVTSVTQQTGSNKGRSRKR